MWNDGSLLTDHILKRFVVYNKSTSVAHAVRAV